MSKRKRINITLTPEALRIIDDEAEAWGWSRSYYLSWCGVSVAEEYNKPTAERVKNNANRSGHRRVRNDRRI